ncbi:MAG TPA: type II toxin-antitoxin system RelE/ParE family toxin [Verrucomicrobiae bacterium]
MTYRVDVRPEPQKFLRKLRDEELAARLVAAMRALASNPRPTGCKKLKGNDLWRIRVSDYRILYQIHDRVLVVLVVSIGHRSDVYR